MAKKERTRKKLFISQDQSNLIISLIEDKSSASYIKTVAGTNEKEKTCHHALLQTANQKPFREFGHASAPMLRLHGDLRFGFL